MKFASFFMAEYANMVTVSALRRCSSWAYGIRFFRSNMVRADPGADFRRQRAGVFLPCDEPARPFDRITLGVRRAVLGAAAFPDPVVQPILLPLFWFSARSA